MAGGAFAAGPGWRGELLERWRSSPERRGLLEAARAEGLFQMPSRAGTGAVLSEEELMWTEQYGSGGAYMFWSVGYPKVELGRLLEELRLPEEGLAAVVLGSGLGLEVDHLARSAPGLPCVAGVDFALPAVERARASFGQTAGASFYHGDVFDLPPPSMPLDLVVDNTVFQNVHGGEGEPRYLEALRRISKPGHTVLHLNLMSREGVESRPAFKPCLEFLDLPLLREAEIERAFSKDWRVLACREGVYDLNPEAAEIPASEAFYSFGGQRTPGIPSWWLLLARK